jgi:hypothetical protein
MPIPFHETEDLDQLGAAGFLKIEANPTGRVLRGGLLVITARGEPLEFAYNRVELPDTFLWRRADLRRSGVRRLTASLLTVCAHNPSLLVCLAAEVDSALFGLDLRVAIPVARLGPPRNPHRRVDRATGEVLEEQLPAQVSWEPEPPAAGSAAHRLVSHLGAHGLLFEPFERVSVGLREVYAAHDGTQP